MVLLITFSAQIIAEDIGPEVRTDSVITKNRLETKDRIKKDKVDSVKLNTTFSPDSKKSILFSALLPGLGQIYNRKYWKLPLVYGSFLGCMYAISWNGTQYMGYKKAYEDWNDNDPKTQSWRNYLPYNMRNEDPSTWGSSYQDAFNRSLQNRKNFYRRYRDLSYIVSVGVYALWILDAYVDAQLFNFDINPEITMKVEPTIFERTKVSPTSIGLQCNINF